MISRPPGRRNRAHAAAHTGWLSRGTCSSTASIVMASKAVLGNGFGESAGKQLHRCRGLERTLEQRIDADAGLNVAYLSEQRPVRATDVEHAVAGRNVRGGFRDSQSLDESIDARHSGRPTGAPAARARS